MTIYAAMQKQTAADHLVGGCFFIMLGKRVVIKSGKVCKPRV